MEHITYYKAIEEESPNYLNHGVKIYVSFADIKAKVTVKRNPAQVPLLLYYM
jgi:hypothetical protein